VWFLAIEEAEGESGERQRRDIIHTLFEEDGRELRSLCFGAVFLISRRVLATFGKRRLPRRRRPQSLIYKLGMPLLNLLPRRCGSLRRE
jgi:hypothetical protein